MGGVQQGVEVLSVYVVGLQNVGPQTDWTQGWGETVVSWNPCPELERLGVKEMNRRESIMT